MSQLVSGIFNLIAAAGWLLTCFGVIRWLQDLKFRQDYRPKDVKEGADATAAAPRSRSDSLIQPTERTLAMGGEL